MNKCTDKLDQELRASGYLSTIEENMTSCVGALRKLVLFQLN